MVDGKAGITNQYFSSSIEELSAKQEGGPSRIEKARVQIK